MRRRERLMKRSQVQSLLNVLCAKMKGDTTTREKRYIRFVEIASGLIKDPKPEDSIKNPDVRSKISIPSFLLQIISVGSLVGLLAIFTIVLLPPRI
jgi:hypothetical protein